MMRSALVLGVEDRAVVHALAVDARVTQFCIVRLFVQGGPYSTQLSVHVQMEPVYGISSKRMRVVMDAVTIVFLVFFPIFLAVGRISSTNTCWNLARVPWCRKRPFAGLPNPLERVNPVMDS